MCTRVNSHWAGTVAKLAGNFRWGRLALAQRRRAQGRHRPPARVAGHRLVKLIFACQRAGLVAVPISPLDPSKLGMPAAHRHLLRAMAQTRPAAAIADVSRRRRPLVLPPPPP